MIQIRRGSTKAWQDKKSPILAAGQPGYDKEKHIIKVGDGEKPWKDLPPACGLSDKGILDSEEEAKKKLKDDANDITVITYGTEAPNKDTVGQLYLQHYEDGFEVDRVVESGANGIWTYRKWLSGKAECYGILEIGTDVQENIGGLYGNSQTMPKLAYPFVFKDIPCEVASIQSPGGIVWLASKDKNTSSQSALYMIISPNKQTNRAIYQISLTAVGFWK